MAVFSAEFRLFCSTSPPPPPSSPSSSLSPSPPLPPPHFPTPPPPSLLTPAPPRRVGGPQGRVAHGVCGLPLWLGGLCGQGWPAGGRRHRQQHRVLPALLRTPVRPTLPAPPCARKPGQLSTSCTTAVPVVRGQEYSSGLSAERGVYRVAASLAWSSLMLRAWLCTCDQAEHCSGFGLSCDAGHV